MLTCAKQITRTANLQVAHRNRIACAELRILRNHLKPLLTFLRDTQNYVHLAAHGLTLWDMASSRFERDVEQWQPLLAWLDA